MVETKNDWTDAKHEALASLYSRGWSATQIAMELGITTKNAVAGKIRKLKLKRPATLGLGARKSRKITHTPKPGNWSAPIGKARKSIRGVRQEPLQLDIAPLTPVSLPSGKSPVPILDLSPQGCKWAMTPHTARSHLFCGEVKEVGRPYCTKHRRIAKVQVRIHA